MHEANKTLNNVCLEPLSPRAAGLPRPRALPHANLIIPKVNKGARGKQSGHVTIGRTILSSAGVCQPHMMAGTDWRKGGRGSIGWERVRKEHKGMAGSA